MTEPARKRIRTCVGCATQSGKADLRRIVRCADGSVTFDETGRVAGRGAYVCSLACLDAAYRSGKLQRALKAPVGRGELEKIASAMSEAANEEGRR